MSRRLPLLSSLVGLLLGGAAPSTAQITPHLSFQGRVVEDGVPATGA